MGNNGHLVLLLLVVIGGVMAIPLFEDNWRTSAVELQKVFCKVAVDNISTGLAVCHNSNDTIHLVQGNGILLNINSSTNQINITSIGGVDNQGTNLGAGSFVYKTQIGANLAFRSFIGTGGIGITQNPNDLTFSLNNIPKSEISPSGQFAWSNVTKSGSFLNEIGSPTSNYNMNNKILNNEGTAVSAGDVPRSDQLGLLGSLVTSHCGNSQTLQYQSSNSTWVCVTAGGVSSVSGTTGNVTSTGGVNPVINLGSNVVTTGGSSQVITKGLTTNSLTLGGDENANSHKITNIATPISTGDAQNAGHLGLLGSLVSGVCADNQIIRYQSSNSTWVCATASTGTVTSVSGTTGNVTSTGGANPVINLGSNVVTTGGSSQVITKGITLNSLTLGGNAGGGNKNFTSLNNVNATKFFQGSNQVIDTLTQGTGITISGSGNSRSISTTALLTAITSLDGDIQQSQNLHGTVGQINLLDSGSSHTFSLAIKVNNQTCSSGRFSSFDNKTGNFVCSGGTGAITSLDGNTASSQTLAITAGNLTLVDAGATHTFNLGSNAVVTNGVGQTFSSGKKITVTPSASTSGFNLGTLGSDLTSPRQGDLRIVGQTLKFNDNTNTTRTIDPASYITSAVTSATGTSRNVTVSASTGAVTWNLGDNVVITGGKSQNFTKAINFTSGAKLSLTGSATLAGINIGYLSADPSSLTNGDCWINGASQTFRCRMGGVSFSYPPASGTNTWSGTNTFTGTLDVKGTLKTPNSGTVFRNPSSTFGTTLISGAVTANRTLNLPAITGTDTLASLGLAQSFTTKQTFTPTSSTSSFNLGTLGSDLTSPRQGDLRIVGTTIKYNDNTNTTRTLDPTTLLTAAITSLNGDTTASQNIVRQVGNTTVVNSTNTHTIGLGVNVLIANGAKQTITKEIQHSGLTRFNGGIAAGYVAKTGSYSLTAFDVSVGIDASGTNPSIATLPSASTNTNSTFIIKKTDTSHNVVQIVGTSSQTIDGALRYNMTQPMQSIIVQSDGSNWKIIDQQQPTLGDHFIINNLIANRGWYSSAGVSNAWTPTAIAPTTTTIMATYFPVGKTTKLDKIQLEVSTLVAGSTCRMAIYQDNGTGYPSFIVQGSDVGTVSGASTGVKTNTFASAITLQAGNYWLANQCSTATTIQLRAIPAINALNPFGEIGTMGTATAGGTNYVATNTFGAFPQTFPTSGAAIGTGAIPWVQVHRLG